MRTIGLSVIIWLILNIARIVNVYRNNSTPSIQHLHSINILTVGGGTIWFDWKLEGRKLLSFAQAKNQPFHPHVALSIFYPYAGCISIRQNW